MLRNAAGSGLVIAGLALAVLAGCYDSGDYPEDFKVLGSYPGNQQTNVPQNAQVVIRFTNAVDHKTIQGTKQVILVDSSNSVLPTTFTFKGELLYVTPTSPFAPGTTYGIAVRPGVRDIFGANISVPYSATFSTGSSVGTIPNFPPFTIAPPPGPPAGGPPGTFTGTGPMVYARARHVMTLMNNGKVLCTGGENDFPLGRVLRQAELFDPTTYQWTVSQSLGQGINGMHYERYGHTSTLLLDGRVLIAGGADNHKVLDVGEIYNPKYDVFSLVPGRMQNHRVFHTAERLNNGNVLLIAGWENSPTQTGASSANQQTTLTSYLMDTMEVYDAYTGTFTMTALPLMPKFTVNQNRQAWWTSGRGNVTPAGRMYHTSNLLPDGSVMVCGGYGEPWLNQALSTDDAQLYMPSQGGSGMNGTVLHCGTNLRAPRLCHTSNMLQKGDAAGMVIVAGGFCNSPYTGVLSSCEIFDYTEIAQSGTWQGDRGVFAQLAQSLTLQRHNHTGNILHGGKDAGGILYTGGAQHTGVFNYNAPTPYARLYPWLEPTGCGACRLTFTSDVFTPFAFGKHPTHPFRGINVTSQIQSTQDANGNPTDMSQFYPMGVYFHAGVEFSNGVVLITGGSWCPNCMMGPNAWSTYYPPNGIVNGIRINGPSLIYNP